LTLNMLWYLLPELVLLAGGIAVLVIDMAATRLSRDAFNEEVSESRR